MKPLKHYEREALIWGAKLSANEKILLLALNSFVDGNGECYPGLETLAKMTGLTERTCRTVRDKLRAKGLIETFRRSTEQGFRTSDRYKVTFSAFPHLPENRVSLPEGLSTREGSLPENRVSLPENCVSPTGKLRQNLPEGFSRDLSSKNYPVRTIQREEGEETANAAPTAVVEILEPESSHEPQAEMSASLVTQGKGCGQEREIGVGAKSSAAARRPKINAERWIETYNRHKPDKWATCAAMNEKRSKAIAKAVEAVGEEKALELLAAGLSHLRVSPDAWWRDKAMGIDNALANLRFIGWGEAGLSAGLNPQAVAESGLTDNQIQSARRQKEAAGSRMLQVMRESRRKQEEAAAALRASALPFN